MQGKTVQFCLLASVLGLKALNTFIFIGISNGNTEIRSPFPTRQRCHVSRQPTKPEAEVPRTDPEAEVYYRATPFSDERAGGGRVRVSAVSGRWCPYIRALSKQPPRLRQRSAPLSPPPQSLGAAGSNAGGHPLRLR